MLFLSVKSSNFGIQLVAESCLAAFTASIIVPCPEHSSQELARAVTQSNFFEK